MAIQFENCLFLAFCLISECKLKRELAFNENQNARMVVGLDYIWNENIGKNFVFSFTRQKQSFGFVCEIEENGVSCRISRVFQSKVYWVTWVKKKFRWCNLVDVFWQINGRINNLIKDGNLCVINNGGKNKRESLGIL